MHFATRRNDCFEDFNLNQFGDIISITITEMHTTISMGNNKGGEPNVYRFTYVFIPYILLQSGVLCIFEREKYTFYMLVV